ncbi:MAG: ATP-binding cassette domain-containing protein [Lachnospiraceae bacterium]|nr:ATP-binding cassette domain-containing protein [Lachnospiraceae bacterium]
MKIQSFCKSYDRQSVLEFPGMELVPGKIYAVIGANGSGKSTFAKCLAGIAFPDEKRNVLEKGVSVGYMPQKSYAFRMSVEKNISLGGNDKERAEQLMNALQIQHLAKKNASYLSGGETARMAMARILMKKFDLLILDEPTAAMDVETTFLAEELIKSYCCETGCTLIVVTHSLQQAKRIADEVLFFHKGKLIETGAKEHILDTPKKAETKRFLEFYGI